MQKTTLGVIIGNRGFFPDHLCESGRAEVLQVLEEEGITVVILSPEDTNTSATLSTRFGSVETLQDAEKCAALFKQHRDEIDGVLVTLPNFGDERGVANAIRMSALDVPVLIQAFPDELGKMTVADRRDSFCGKMSVCNNLVQYGIPFSLTTLHTVAPDSGDFRQDLRQFAGTCRVVRGLRGARIGALGARPAAFITVRYSEKLLEEAGISVEVLDLSEVFGRANRLSDDDAEVRRKLDEIRAYVPTKGIPAEALTKMAKFALVTQRWMDENQLVATAVQCWTSMEEFFGVVPCTVMSMMSNALMPSACEMDVTGAVGMYAMTLASGRPSALVDWNNNYGDDPDKGVVFHCSNLPKALFTEAQMDYQEIIAGTVGKENTYGTVVGRLKSGSFTYCRVSTDDSWGVIRAYVGEGELTDDPLETFGGYGVVRIPDLQGLLHHICENGFEHHVAINLSQTAAAVHEALDKYMDWDVYYHQ
jgi:L-fucose isomerase-like protein